MASWIIHLRIADALSDRLDVETSHFLAGNIAPDCGVDTGNRVFDPPSEITHFTRADKDACEYLRFWEEFGRDETDKSRRSFYLGYFAHLMTDVLWVKWINNPTKKKFSTLYQSDKDAYYRRVKGDWYGQDFHFLQTHPDFRSYRLFRQLMDYENDFLPFYGPEHMKTRFRIISQFYGDGGTPSHRRFIYLTTEQADRFVRRAADVIYKEICDICQLCAK